MDLNKLTNALKNQWPTEEIDVDSTVFQALMFADHDYLGYHVLGQVWDKVGPLEEQGWRYVLLFYDHNVGEMVIVREFDNDWSNCDVPWFEAGELIQRWHDINVGE